MNLVRTLRATVSWSVWGDLAEHGGPSDEVMGEHRADEPRRVGEELSGRNVFQPGTLFQIFYGEFDGCMGPVELVDLDCVASEVCHKGEVPPVRGRAVPGDLQGGCAGRSVAFPCRRTRRLEPLRLGCSRSGSTPTHRCSAMALTTGFTMAIAHRVADV